MGLETRKDSGESPETGSNTLDNNSAYINGELGPKAPLSVNAGARIDDSSVWGSVIDPRVGAKLWIEDTMIKMSVSQSFRAPTINELYWNDPSFGMFGNPALQPERATSLNISADREMGWSSISCNYYLNKISDMIDWEQTGAFTWSPVNISSAKVEGVVVEARSRIMDNMTLKLGYNYEKATDTATGLTIAYSPEQKFNAGLEIMLCGTTTDFNVRSVSQVFTDTLNTKILPGYNVADANIGWSIAGAAVSLGVYNIFNEQYSEAVGNDPTTYAARNYPMPGRNFEISVKI